MTAALAAVFATSASRVFAQRQADAGQALIGIYDGGQMEMAAGLELRGDGRFRYALSYGALDEEAEGRWSVTGGTVVLTSDRVTPPRLVLVEQRTAPDRQVLVKLDLPPGMSGQYFRVEFGLADGSAVDHQLTEQGELPPSTSSARATSVTLVLPIAGLSSVPVRLSGDRGYRLRFRFEPNDLGKVAFAGTVLQIDGKDILLRRHDRTIRFRRRPAPKPPSAGTANDDGFAGVRLR